MDRNDRVRASYQHCCLRYVMNEKMTNQSLRERFKLPEDKAATVSQIIAATVEAGKIKPADPAQTSTRYRHYVPFGLEEFLKSKSSGPKAGAKTAVIFRTCLLKGKPAAAPLASRPAPLAKAEGQGPEI